MNCKQSLHDLKRFAFHCSNNSTMQTAGLQFMTSCPLSKALITLCRGERSERICLARTVTERKVYLALREKKPNSCNR